MKPEKYRENAIRYLSEGYDPECRERLLSGEDTPHPVHELPIIEAHIAGAHSRDEEVSKLEKALHNVNEWCHQLRNKLYEQRSSWISVEDNLPDPHTPVYAKNDKRTWFFALMTDNRVRPWYDIVGRHPEEVTHWKPIPKPILKKGE